MLHNSVRIPMRGVTHVACMNIQFRDAGAYVFKYLAFSDGRQGAVLTPRGLEMGCRTPTVKLSVLRSAIKLCLPNIFRVVKWNQCESCGHVARMRI